MDNTKMSKREKAKVTREAIRSHMAAGSPAVPDPKKAAADFLDNLAQKSAISLEDIQSFLAKKTDAVDLAVKLGAAVGAKLPEIDVQDFRRSGYLPEALVNFIALVGWSPGGDREIMTREEMLQLFSLEGIQKTPGRFDRKKLAWMNGEYIRKATLDRLADAVDSFNAVTDTPLKKANRATLKELLAMYQERMVTLAEMAENARFFFEEPVYDPKAMEKHIQNNGGLDFLRAIQSILAPVAADQWNKTGLAEPMERMLALGEKRGAAAQALRVAVSGGAVSPPMLETLVLLGRDKTLTRIAAQLHTTS
jgi:glutamyl-tRNA synthetase